MKFELFLGCAESAVLILGKANQISVFDFSHDLSDAMMQSFVRQLRVRHVDITESEPLAQ